MINFTRVPNFLLRNRLGLSAMERLFLIYLLSHKDGYTVTDVQCSDNTGINRGTIPGLRKKLTEKRHIDCWQGDKHGWVYNVRLNTLNLPAPRHANPAEKKQEPAVDMIIDAFQIGIQKFKDSKYYPKIIEKEYIQGKWHLSEYKASPGGIKNINVFLSNATDVAVRRVVDAFNEKLHKYLIEKIFNHDFLDYKSGKELTPTISLFLKGSKTFEEMDSYDYSDYE